MSEVTRRRAIQQLAGGTILASASVAAATAVGTGSTGGQDPATPSDPAVLRVEGRLPPATSPVAIAKVSRCRSWDTSVYLDAGPALRGYAQLTPAGFAIASAAQAAGRKVAFRHHGHQPHWADGAGCFEGAVLAFDRRDLGDDATSFGGLA